MPYNCILGCRSRADVPLHKFPNPNRFMYTFKAWVQIIGNKPYLADDIAFYRSKRICDIHFANKDRNRNNRLNCQAVPSLYLLGNDNLVDYSARTVDGVLEQPSTSSQVFPTEHPVESPIEAIEFGGSLRHSTTNQNYEIDVQKQSVLSEHNYYRREVPETTKVSLKLGARKKSLPVVCRTEQRKVRILQRKIHKMKKDLIDFKTRLSNADKLSKDRAFNRVIQSMTPAAKLFTNMQFWQTSKKPPGRRFSIEEKILSLSIFKKSRKCYGLLAKLFALPSPKTLKVLLAEIKINSGTNPTVFQKIKETVNNLNKEDRICSLIFDKMSISPQMQYDSARDKLRGFSDLDRKFSDHVLVFMVKGVKANFKQPVAYYFTNSMGKYELKRILKEVIAQVQATGLIVLCTICDQGTANVCAINELVKDTKKIYLKKGKEWRHDNFEINKRQIVPLFDVPHLINLLTKDLSFVDYDDSAKVKIVKWDYFHKVYAADKSRGDFTLLHKITEEHLVPEKIKKMKVKTAAQIFSHSFAVATEHLTARGFVEEDCRQLIPLVSLIDKLFDSLNSSTYHIPNGKRYKACVKERSPHHDLWQKCVKTFKTMKFIHIKKSGNKVRIVESSAPTIKKFIKTIEGIKIIWHTLSRKYSFDSMLTRNFNQDPLENFFGNIRSYGARNIAPNSVAFEGAFKALLLNNFNTPHSLKAIARMIAIVAFKTMIFS